MWKPEHLVQRYPVYKTIAQWSLRFVVIATDDTDRNFVSPKFLMAYNSVHRFIITDFCDRHSYETDDLFSVSI